MRGGVSILLEPGIRLPVWIRNQDLNVTQDWVQLGQRRVRRVRIRGADACFGSGGFGLVQMSGSSEYWEAFKPNSVLEIRTLGGQRLLRNYYLCQHCGRLAGEIVKTEPNLVCSFVNALFKCKKCNREWWEAGI